MKRMISSDALRPAFTVLFLCLGLQLVAQMAAPTLTAGLSTVTGQKGDLDIELLSQIISEKQEEVKREVLQRKILDDMQGQSLALQNFVYSSFYALLSYSDKKAIEKELLKQVSIMALEVGFAEAFLRVSFMDPRSDENLLSEFTALQQDTQNTYTNAIAIDAEIIASKPLRDALRRYLANAYQLASPQLDSAYKHLIIQLKGGAFSKLFSIDRYMEAAVREALKGDPERKRSGEVSDFSGILLDIIYDVVQNNKTLQERGFGHLHPNLALRYDSLNLYVNNKARRAGERDETIRRGRARHVDFSDLHRVVDDAMGIFVDYHPLFFDFADNIDFSIANLRALRSQDLQKSHLDSLLLIVNDIVIDLSDRMENRTRDLRLDSETINALESDLENIMTSLDEFQDRGGSEGVEVYDYYFVRQHVDPFVAKLITLGLIDKDGVQTTRLIKDYMFNRLVNQLDSRINNTTGVQLLDNVSYEKYGPLIRIISALSRLDEVRSYEQVFNTLGQLGMNNLGDTRLRFIQDIVYYVEAYTTINRDENLINLEVEGLLLKILSIYENRASGNFQLYFGVGLGQTFAKNYTHRDTDRPLMLNDSTELDQLSFASEKIGLKLKIVNYKKRQVTVQGDYFKPREIHRSRQPIVSDIYVFTYGSGLLYNVANLTSAGSNFDHVMIGFGAGAAFFNSLDVNVWVAAPMVSGEGFGQSLARRQFFGFSFDIKLTEYLSALGDKRRKAQLTN